MEYLEVDKDKSYLMKILIYIFSLLGDNYKSNIITLRCLFGGGREKDKDGVKRE